MTTTQPGQEQRMDRKAEICLEAAANLRRCEPLDRESANFVATVLEQLIATRPTADLGEDGEWQPIETAPHAMHFLAAYFYEEAGEWVYDVATMHHDHVCGANEGSGPFTHWMPLPKPPAVLSRSGG